MEPPQERDFDDLKQTATAFIHSNSGKLGYFASLIQ
jgi:hypothetical protein